MLFNLKTLSFSAALALALGLAPQVNAQEATNFTRFKDGDKAGSGALQVAKASYKNPKTDVEIVLYGVVHIADKAYYEAVQKDLDSYDVVLWEGVKPGKSSKPDPKMAGIGNMQKVMCDMLGLTFQKDGIDYKRDHFVWADINQDQFQKELGEGAEGGAPGLGGMFSPEMLKNMGPMLKMGAQFAKTLFKNNPAMQDNMKRRFAEQLANAGNGDAPGMTPAMKRVILDVRNEAVEVVLKDQLKTVKSGKVAIFYGAAHMADFHDRLAKLGYTQTEKSWLSAWSIGAGVEAGAELAPEAEGKKAPKRQPAKRRWI